MGSAGTSSPSRHLRYERDLELPAGSAGQACLVLDGPVFAHTESPGAGDVRIFGNDGRREFEVPFALIESGPATLDAQPATVGNVAVRADALAFDLSMPAGAYSEVDLQLNAKNFLGAAQVEGRDAQGRLRPLGTFAIFDLSADGLARSTVLTLPESAFPVLHIELRLVDRDGRPIVPSPAMLQGASVPP